MSLFSPAGKSLQTLTFAFVISIVNTFYQAYSSFYTISAAESLQNFLNNSYATRGIELSEVQSLLFSNYGIFVALLLSILSIEFLLPELFFISRILGAALSNLNFGALALFVTEFPATKLRGVVIFVSGICYNLASNIGMLLGMDAFLGRNLEFLIGLGLIPNLLGILTSIPLKETPKFLLLNREDKEGALKALHFYQGDSIDHETALVEIMKERQQNDRRPMLSMLREVFTQRHLRLATLLGFCALQMTVGTWPVITTLFADHFPLREAQLYSSICSGLSLATNVPGTLLASRVSRRKLLLYAGVVNALCIVFYAFFDRLTLLHVEFRYGCLVSNLVYFCSFGISLGTIPFYLCGELFPQNFRSMGQSVVFFISLCSQFAFNILILPAYSAVGVYAFFPLFTAPQLLCLTLLWIYLPETSGREVHEIVDELKRGKKQTKVNDCSDRRRERAKCPPLRFNK
uniref:MFS domain-containing protein n=1 Tax=Globodera pallida TaxID=36090 RepID=A0A183BKD7_GLOPA